MAVFRVAKTKNYTVMANYHLNDKRLTLKTKGLLSVMLSLPDGWDYTLRGLAYISRENIDAIRTGIWELEKAGYITRQQGRDEKGKPDCKTCIVISSRDALAKMMVPRSCPFEGSGVHQDRAQLLLCHGAAVGQISFLSGSAPAQYTR